MKKVTTQEVFDLKDSALSIFENSQFSVPPFVRVVAENKLTFRIQTDVRIFGEEIVLIDKAMFISLVRNNIVILLRSTSNYKNEYLDLANNKACHDRDSARKSALSCIYKDEQEEEEEEEEEEIKSYELIHKNYGGDIYLIVSFNYPIISHCSSCISEYRIQGRTLFCGDFNIYLEDEEIFELKELGVKYD